MGDVFPNSKVAEHVYHASPEFVGNKFDARYLGKATGKGTASAGFHFSDKATAGIHGIPPSLKSGKPSQLIQARINLQNPVMLDNMTGLRGTISNPIDPATQVKAWREAGHDGIIIKSYQGGPDYVVFEPKNIKITHNPFREAMIRRGITALGRIASGVTGAVASDMVLPSSTSTAADLAPQEYNGMMFAHYPTRYGKWYAREDAGQ